MICITLAVTIPGGIVTAKHITVSVVQRDIPTDWIRRCLAHVGRVDYFDAPRVVSDCKSLNLPLSFQNSSFLPPAMK